MSSMNVSKRPCFSSLCLVVCEILSSTAVVTVGTLTPSYADVVWSTDGRVVSQSKPMTRTTRTSNVARGGGTTIESF
jgi:hypothetical protein